jgi:beta-glucuronidase
MRVGLRTVGVRDGHLELNGRRLDLRGTSIQEDVPGRGPAMTDADVERIVADLKAVGANVTRAHYLLDPRLLSRLDEEGIMVWSQAPVYHRDVQLRTKAGRSLELASLRRTVLAARNHPSVITHSVANELSPQPDENPTTGAWLNTARELAEDLDHTPPRVRRHPRLARVPQAARLRPLRPARPQPVLRLVPGRREPRDRQPRRPRAVPAPGPPQLPPPGAGDDRVRRGVDDGRPAGGQGDVRVPGGVRRQEPRARQRLEFLSGAIYWTLREFAVKPDWDGGAERKDVVRDSIHNKGLITYADGVRKPAWEVARRHFDATPLYRSEPSRAFAAVTGDGPRAEGGVGSTALTAGVVGLLLTLAGLMLWFLRDIWRLGGEPEPTPEYEAGDPDPERRLELVA